MARAIKVTNRFTGDTSVYDGVEAFRRDAKGSCYDVSLMGIIDLLADAYAAGRATKTYEWMLGVAIG